MPSARGARVCVMPVAGTSHLVFLGGDWLPMAAKVIHVQSDGSRQRSRCSLPHLLISGRSQVTPKQATHPSKDIVQDCPLLCSPGQRCRGRRKVGRSVPPAEGLKAKVRRAVRWRYSGTVQAQRAQLYGHLQVCTRRLQGPWLGSGCSSQSLAHSSPMRQTQSEDCAWATPQRRVAAHQERFVKAC